MTSYAATMRGASGQTTSRHERVLRVRAATFIRRFCAAFVDLTLVLFVSVGAALAAAFALGIPIPSAKELGPDLLLAGILDRNPVVIGTAGLLLGMALLYELYLGGVAGQTLGKRLLGLRVISVRGTRPGPLRGLIRFVALVVAVLPAGLGWIWCLFDRERRGLHDHLAGTYVIFDD